MIPIVRSIRSRKTGSGIPFAAACGANASLLAFSSVSTARSIAIAFAAMAFAALPRRAPSHLKAVSAPVACLARVRIHPKVERLVQQRLQLRRLEHRRLAPRDSSIAVVGWLR